MAKLLDSKNDDDLTAWGADADVFVPQQRRASLMSLQAQGSAVGRRISSLGSLHHAGHSESTSPSIVPHGSS
jgi:hypothetical protein